MAYVECSTVIPQKKEIIFNYVTDMNKYITFFPNDLSLSLTPPVAKMKKGAEYEFILQRFGFSRTWVTKIDLYKKNECFVEYETSSLFESWRHECRLQDHGGQSTLIADYIEYTVGFGLIGKLVDDLWLKKDFKRIYECIHRKLTVSI